MLKLTIEGKILIFKTLAISKVVHLPLLKDVPSSTIAQLERIQKHFIWKNGNPKLKHTTLCNDYEQGGLKKVIFSPKYQVSNVLGLKCYMIIVFISGT